VEGYIKIYRSLLDWEWWGDQSTTRLWLYILVSASFKTTQWRGRTIYPGQLICSRNTLTDNTGLSERSIRTSLNKLKTTGELSIETTSKYSVITIANWSKFQCDEGEATSETTNEASHERPANDQQTTSKRPHRKNVKNVKNNNTLLTPLEKATEDFKEYRKKMGKPMTERAVELLHSKLTKLAGNDEALKVAILEQSIFHGWQGVFALKEQQNKSDDLGFR
jgi:DNA replication protein DnaD